MELLEPSELRDKWILLTDTLSKNFGEKPDLQTVIFLIGVQELGRGYAAFSKDEKQDLMHIATCKLLSYWGYYKLTGKDEGGWPVWKKTENIPSLTMLQQERLLRQSIIEYFRENEIL